MITSGSVFNIKAKSLRLGDFDRHETELLLLAHTRETGQVFTPEALVSVWQLSAGQPCLVNALAYGACFDLKSGRDRTQPLSQERIHAGKERLIQDHVTHLDQLADKLKEPGVRRIVEPFLRDDKLDNDSPFS